MTFLQTWTSADRRGRITVPGVSTGSNGSLGTWTSGVGVGRTIGAGDGPARASAPGGRRCRRGRAGRRRCRGARGDGVGVAVGRGRRRGGRRRGASRRGAVGRGRRRVGRARLRLRQARVRRVRVVSPGVARDQRAGETEPLMCPPLTADRRARREDAALPRHHGGSARLSPLREVPQRRAPQPLEAGRSRGSLSCTNGPLFQSK